MRIDVHDPNIRRRASAVFVVVAVLGVIAVVIGSSARPAEPL